MEDMSESMDVGTVSSRAAWSALASDPHAVLVDVRTASEWSWVGVPDTSSLTSRMVFIEWMRSDGEPNEDFCSELAEAGVGEESAVYFLCRSGARSQAAAEASASKVGQPFNILDGFEGPLDADGHRGTSTGWKASGLPWRQS